MNTWTIAGLCLITAASQWGCYFLVDRSGIVGGSDTADAAPADAALNGRTTEDGGMLAYWSFDEAKNGVVEDLSGRGHHGQLGTAPSLPGGRSGQALGSAMTVSSLDGQHFPARGTLSFWLRADFTGSEVDGRAVFDDYDRSRAHIFVRVPNGRRQVDLQIACQDPATVDYPFVVDIAAPPNKTWMHLIVVWDSVLHSAAVYLDGKLLQVGPLPASWTPSDENVAFAQYFPAGLVDEARLYERALSAAEVGELP